MIEQDIDTLSLCLLQNLPIEVAFAVVDGVVGAQFQATRAFFRRTRRHEDRRARCARPRHTRATRESAMVERRRMLMLARVQSS